MVTRRFCLSLIILACGILLTNGHRLSPNKVMEILRRVHGNHSEQYFKILNKTGHVLSSDTTVRRMTNEGLAKTLAKKDLDTPCYDNKRSEEQKNRAWYSLQDQEQHLQAKHQDPNYLKDSLIVNQESGFLNSNESCTSMHYNNPTKSVEQKSNCPWTYRVNFNENRMPQAIKEAKCMCHSCTLYPSRVMPDRLGCMPIFEQVPVLFKQCRSNSSQPVEYEWQPGHEMISIGCTCAIAAPGLVVQ